MTYERTCTCTTDWVWLTSCMFTSEMYMYVDRKSVVQIAFTLFVSYVRLRHV